jgi:catechol 2,3-dioxygenase-like lactoylglutathione lyase family enzyme
VGRITNVTFACRDPARLAEFWATVLDYEVQHLPDEVLQQLRDAGFDLTSRAACVDPTGVGPRLFFMRKEKTETTSIPIHLDVAVDDAEAAVARFEELGARVKERKSETLGPFSSSWIVMADPEGNGFCVHQAS